MWLPSQFLSESLCTDVLVRSQLSDFHNSPRKGRSKKNLAFMADQF